MRILAVGDIMGAPGREFVYNNLGRIRAKYNIDFCIANGENSADTNGITSEIANMLLMSGVDVITMGNHTFGNYESATVLEDNESVIRPLNYPNECEGNGYTIYDTGRIKIAVVNLIGRVSMPPSDCPFHAIDELLKKIEAELIFVDMHAEATSEKIAMGYYLDGRATAVFGTHTHVQTADEKILQGGTGFICDLGMTGVEESVLGVKKEIVISSFLNPAKRVMFKKAAGNAHLGGCIFEVDENTKKTVSVERIHIDKV